MTTTTTGFTKAKALALAIAEAKQHLGWRAGPAKKYTHKYEGVFGKGRYPWCASFVTWCCDQAGLNLPVSCPTGYTFALVEAWQMWAQSKGFYIDNAEGVVAKPGDIVLFDWDQKNLNETDKDWEDHIGFVVDYLPDSGFYATAEGNVNDVTALKNRDKICIQGFIRIPDGYHF